MTRAIFLCRLQYTAPHVYNKQLKRPGEKIRVAFSSMFFREHASSKMIVARFFAWRPVRS